MLSLKHLGRYKELSLMFMKYGRSDILKNMELPLPQSSSFQELPPAQEFVDDLQKLGPTFIKLGQFFSTQEDFFPPYYQEALTHLQDDVEPFPFEEVEKIIVSELGVKIKDAFLDFNPVPLAAGSLAQVHQATLMSGKTVAVKVQRPGIEKLILDDLNVLKELAQFLDKHESIGKHFYWENRIDSFRSILLDELDFRKEARNLIVLSNNLKSFEDIIIPIPVMDYTNAHVLTMEYVSSKRITTLHPLLKMEIDGEPLVKELLKAYLKQVFEDGFVHIDPHPGNVYLTDTNQIALLDVGMVEHLSPRFQQDLLKLVIAISDGRGEEAADLVLKLGEADEGFDHAKFQNNVADLIAKYKGMTWEEMGMGKTFLKIAEIASKSHLKISQKFNTLGKMLLNLDKIGKILAPSLNPTSFIQENVESLLGNRVRSFFDKSTFSNFLLNTLEILDKLPVKIDNFLEALGRKEFEIKVQAFDENRLMRGFEKVANRITLGLILAAMIVSGALLMRIQTKFQIFEYPGLAILLFSAAFIGGVIFIFNILISDKKKK